jgi:Cof subfamily protein (haloacid dehalogenase superfamily)
VPHTFATLPPLVATDLDGTLLRSDGTISDRTRAAVRAASDAGATVVAATGRPPRWVEGLHLDLGVHALCVCLNGAMLLDLETGEELAHRPFADGVAVDIALDVRAELPGIQFAGQVGARFVREPEWVPMFPHATDLVAPLEVFTSGTVTKLIVRHPDLAHDALAGVVRDVAGERALVTFSGMRIVELSSPGVHKASGLADAADLLGASLRDGIAFGDAPNDLQMLAAAGWGVAVANAHPDVLAVADEVTAANDEDGVAVVLERLLRD